MIPSLTWKIRPVILFPLGVTFYHINVFVFTQERQICHNWHFCAYVKNSFYCNQIFLSLNSANSLKSFRKNSIVILYDFCLRVLFMYTIIVIRLMVKWAPKVFEEVPCPACWKSTNQKIYIQDSTSACICLKCVMISYRSDTVNSNTVNSKFHLIRSFCQIFATFLSFHV